MKHMICLSGEPIQRPHIKEVVDLGCGVELQSYGMKGIASELSWQERIMLHKDLLSGFNGDLAIHGPFIGMDFSHADHLINAAINSRLDMIFEAAKTFSVQRIILHTGFSLELEIFKLEERWFAKQVDFWQNEVTRWADANITVVLENVVEKSPDMMVRIIDAVNHPNLGLCFDVGHQFMMSKLNAGAWIEKMGPRLRHVHLHDNHGQADEHLPIGKGRIDYLPIFKALKLHSPEAVVSLEVDADIETKMANLAYVMDRYK